MVIVASDVLRSICDLARVQIQEQYKDELRALYDPACAVMSQL